MSDEEYVESLRTIQGHRTYSQAHQDLFVRMMTEFKRSGWYLEIGASEAKQSNNTYILERDLGWNGLSIELNNSLAERFNQARRNPCVCADALQFDYSGELAARSFPKQIDYLS